MVAYTPQKHQQSYLYWPDGECTVYLDLDTMTSKCLQQKLGRRQNVMFVEQIDQHLPALPQIEKILKSNGKDNVELQLLLLDCQLNQAGGDESKVDDPKVVDKVTVYVLNITQVGPLKYYGCISSIPDGAFAVINDGFTEEVVQTRLDLCHKFIASTAYVTDLQTFVEGKIREFIGNASIEFSHVNITRSNCKEILGVE